MILLIAEDESHIREGLKKLIPWQEYGIDTIVTAKDGREALDLCGQTHPDILFTDIRMPHINGIELAQRARKSFPELKIIFFSSHTDKEYLKAAIRIHAASFIEKPLNKEELLSVLQEIAASSQEPSEFPQASLKLTLLQIITQETVAPETKRAFELHYGPLQNTFRVFCVRIKAQNTSSDTIDNSKQIESILQDRFSEGIVISWNNEYCGLVWGDAAGDEDVFSSEITAFAHALHRDLLQDSPFVVACGKPVSGFDDVHNSFRSAQQVSARVFFSGYHNGVLLPDDQKSGELHMTDLAERLEASMRYGTQNDAFLIMDEFAQAVNANARECDIDLIRTACLNICLKINEIAREYGVTLAASSAAFPGWGEVSSAETFACAFSELQVLLQSYFKGRYLNARNPAVSAICQYISRNYSDSSLCVKQIARNVGLTSNYICHLFKNEMDKTLIAYITQVRVESAKRILQNSSRTLSEVAASVGFNDTNYFIRVFKKNTGFTPTEFRNQHAAQA